MLVQVTPAKYLAVGRFPHPVSINAAVRIQQLRPITSRVPVLVQMQEVRGASSARGCLVHQRLAISGPLLQ